jgi:hypothetical protein
MTLKENLFAIYLLNAMWFTTYSQFFLTRRARRKQRNAKEGRRTRQNGFKLNINNQFDKAFDKNEKSKMKLYIENIVSLSYRLE